MTLAIVDRTPGSSPAREDLPVWRTCLREVAFADGAQDLVPLGGHVLVEGEAYRWLLEVLCGLRSPILGETQVLGQFREFVASLEPCEAWLGPLGQRLLGDAREVRARHLQGLGARSYGSVVRRHVTDCRRVALIGTGKLARELLPFLTGDGRSVDQWGRRVVPAHGRVVYRQLEGFRAFGGSDDDAALVVAAPVVSALVEGVASKYRSLRRVIDLRGEAGGRPPAVAAPTTTLQELFARMGEASRGARRQVDAARAEIAARARRYELRDELRPFGWDDLCA